jgi:nucleoid DNA-binding protein
MNKQEFIKRIQKKFRGEYRADEIELMVVTVFDEVKEVIREGDELHLNNFGRFYPKEMQSRVVRGGWYPTEEKREFVVPQKIKIGLSSFPATDRYVSTPTDRDIDDDEPFGIY